jgi:hypothetical protein
MNPSKSIRPCFYTYLCYRRFINLSIYQGQVADVIKFGKSDKKLSDQPLIGRYGNGLKS